MCVYVCFSERERHRDWEKVAPAHTRILSLYVHIYLYRHRERVLFTYTLLSYTYVRELFTHTCSSHMLCICIYTCILGVSCSHTITLAIYTHIYRQICIRIYRDTLLTHFYLGVYICIYICTERLRGAHTVLCQYICLYMYIGIYRTGGGVRE